MTDQPKQINFTIVPDDTPGEGTGGEKGPAPRTYANFCSIAHTPFDFTLTFCEVMPLTDKEIRNAGGHTARSGASASLVVSETRLRRAIGSFHVALDRPASSRLALLDHHAAYR